jgi:pimeloyl-ACP methyl ester carboxylesterase
MAEIHNRAALACPISQGATLLALDFAGSGRSEGSWVTLGWWEKDDLASVIQVRELTKSGTVFAACLAFTVCLREPGVSRTMFLCVLLYWPSQHLRDEERTSSIALWGRSMGAATALMHCPRDPLIDGMILDSPFSDLEQLINEIVEVRGACVDGVLCRVGLEDSMPADMPSHHQPSKLRVYCAASAQRFRSQMGLNVPSWILGTVVRMVQSSVWKRTK